MKHSRVGPPRAAGAVRCGRSWQLLAPLMLGLLLLAGCDGADSHQVERNTEQAGEARGGAPEWLESDSRYLARIEHHTEEEFTHILRRAAQAIDAERSFPQFEPIEFILHGSEANFFVRSNYDRYREIVDLAARLDAFGVIDVKICEAWMSMRNVERSDLPAFVETVPYGPAEEKRLQREGYIYF